MCRESRGLGISPCLRASLPVSVPTVLVSSVWIYTAAGLSAWSSKIIGSNSEKHITQPLDDATFDIDRDRSKANWLII